MATKIQPDETDEATDLKLYLPAGLTPPVETGRVERLWRRLFSYAMSAK